MHRELQGTRILKSSRATPYRQTVIIINIFSLNYMMCVKDGWEERGREKDRRRKRHMYRKMRVEETHLMNMAVSVRVWGRGEEEGDRQEKGRQQRRPEHAALLVPTNKAPESVTFPLFLQY